MLQHQEVDLLFLSTSFLEVLLADEYFFNETSFSFKFGGEACNQALWDKISTYCRLHGTLALNAYGPTETTVTISCPVVQDSCQSHIGQAIGDNEFIVIDRFGYECPVGMPGELVIKGPQVSAGYVDQSLRDNEKFVRIAGETDSYHTGDIVVRMASGNHAYIGRRDQQVKFSGYRIELAEIENVIAAADGVTQVAALILEKGAQQFLVVFYSGVVAANEVDALCKAKLPSYMQPSVIEQRTILPLTVNGKIDKTKLSFSEIKSQDTSTLALTEFCAGITAIWQQHLPPANLLANSDFFSSGGHSLAAIKVVQKINDIHQVSLPVSLIFEFPMLSEFAKQVETAIKTHSEQELMASLDTLDESSLSELLEEL